MQREKGKFAYDELVLCLVGIQIWFGKGYSFGYATHYSPGLSTLTH